jgi:hypothetical protein
MRRIRAVSTGGSLRGFLAASRQFAPARHRRLRMTDLEVAVHLLDEFSTSAEERHG